MGYLTRDTSALALARYPHVHTMEKFAIEISLNGILNSISKCGSWINFKFNCFCFVRSICSQHKFCPTLWFNPSQIKNDSSLILLVQQTKKKLRNQTHTHTYCDAKMRTKFIAKCSCDNHLVKCDQKCSWCNSVILLNYATNLFCPSKFRQSEKERKNGKWKMEMKCGRSEFLWKWTIAIESTELIVISNVQLSCQFSSRRKKPLHSSIFWWCQMIFRRCLCLFIQSNELMMLEFHWKFFFARSTLHQWRWMPSSENVKMSEIFVRCFLVHYQLIFELKTLLHRKRLIHSYSESSFQVKIDSYFAPINGKIALVRHKMK